MSKYINNLSVSTAPHVGSSVNTTRIMADVLIALIPALAVSTYVFGPRVPLMTLVCMGSAVAFEHLFHKWIKRPSPVKDLSAAVTGAILAFNLPPGLPLWMGVIGSFVAIVILKGLFGGLGENLVNPAATTRIILLISFASPMTNWQQPAKAAVDGVSQATPLGLLSQGATLPDTWDMFFGFTGGSMGEVSALALLLGGIYLLIRGVIHPITPVAFLGTVVVMALILPGQDPLFHLFAGGLMLGAFFMATDYVTAPFLPVGKLIFGVGCGLITMTIRVFGAFPEGVAYSILIMNILTPHIDQFTLNLRYKGGRK